VAEADGNVLGHAVLSERWTAERKNVYYAFVGVDPGNHGRGIGSRLYQEVIQQATEVGAERVYGEIQEGHREAEEFATRRGFRFTGHAEQMSRLDVHAANLEGYEGIEERIRSEGIRILSLAEGGPTDEGLLRGLYEVDIESSKDIPTSEPWSGFPYDIWLKHFSAPGASPEAYWLAMDGDRPVGMALLERRGPNAAFNGYTGVLRAYRGRGVARGLKWKTIEWARQNGVDFIYTGNHVDNARMLAINVRLGYQPLPRFREVLKDQIP
jgi:GNAT superfamily N-acetyltransferase